VWQRAGNSRKRVVEFGGLRGGLKFNHAVHKPAAEVRLAMHCAGWHNRSLAGAESYALLIDRHRDFPVQNSEDFGAIRVCVVSDASARI
jgi:hypothetical protein